ncbi:hypothetical protein X727_32735 [Mesorhizobium sp. L103C119B0]|nr:hypothetical protein X765_14985 [Mesorhizobium sp. LSHC440B00]ESZ56831.1 hypothetical protein X727_32735 [Mesorhizobium sp. L103C119B0]
MIKIALRAHDGGLLDFGLADAWPKTDACCQAYASSAGFDF